MGITIGSKNNSCDMGYGGFLRFRIKIAKNVGESFGNHYNKLSRAPLFDCEEWFKRYDRKTKELIKNNEVSVEIANFCYQSDCEGSIDKKQAKMIYELIKDCNDDIVYGYTGRSDCAKMKDLKLIFEDCTHYCKKIEWR